MSEIFNIINNLCFTKKKPFLLTNEEIKEFSPYMVNRWISMVDANLAPIVNEHQKMINCMEPETYHTYLYMVIPKSRMKRFSYIKGAKVQKEDGEEIREKLCENLKISQKELDIVLGSDKVKEIINSKGFTQ